MSAPGRSSRDEAEGFRKALRKKADREQPQGRRLLRSRPIEEAVESLAAVPGLTPEQLAGFRQPIVPAGPAVLKFSLEVRDVCRMLNKHKPSNFESDPDTVTITVN